MSGSPVKSRRPRAPAIRKKPSGKFHHPALREALVEAAIQGVEREGHAALSLRRLAAQTGVSQPAIYRHFRSKEALLLEVARRGLLEFDAAQHVAIDAHDDPFAALEASGRSYVRFCVERPGWFRLCFSRFGTEGIRIQRGATEMTSHTKIFAAITRAMGPAGDNVFDVYRAVWGEAHGLTVLAVERIFQLVDTDEERIAAADAALATFVAALRARYSGS